MAKQLKILKKVINGSFRIHLFDKMKDEPYLKMMYLANMGKPLNIDEPKTFNEKMQWLKLYDHNPKYTMMVDKYEVKKYVADLIGEEYIIPTLGVWDRFEDIDFSSLPDEYVLKCTHDSGGLVIVNKEAKLNKALAKIKINKSLRCNYYFFGREWPYKNVKPRIIAEKYMGNTNNSELTDYKLMCFHGKVKCTFVCTDRRTKDGLKVTFFDLDWNKMPFERHYPASKKAIEKPRNYDLMIQLSEILSRDIPFVRVDWYEINGKLYFGELTFFPGNGMEGFTPEEYDYKLGEMITLPEKN